MQKLLQDVHIGSNLQKLRKSRNLSQADMIIRLELKDRVMTRANYAHIEQGIRNVYVSDLILFKEILAEIRDLSYDAFFEGLSPAED